MKTIRELLGKKYKDQVMCVFKLKNIGHKITEQDKKHVRVMSILAFAKDKDIILRIMNSEFYERFEFNEETGEMTYRIVFKHKRKEKKYRGDC